MKAKKSEIKEFIKKQGKFDEYIIDSFIKYCKDYLEHYKSLEDVYKGFNNNSPIFHECGISDIEQKIYPIRLFYDDSGYHFLDDSCSAIINSYHFVYRFKNMEEAVEYTKRNPRKKKDDVIAPLVQGLALSKEPVLKWRVLKDENAYDNIGNIKSISEGGLYRRWAATYMNSQIMYHCEQYYRESSSWKRPSYGSMKIYEVPNDFYEKYKEVEVSECNYGGSAWYYNWNFSKSETKSDKNR